MTTNAEAPALRLKEAKALSLNRGTATAEPRAGLQFAKARRAWGGMGDVVWCGLAARAAQPSALPCSCTMHAPSLRHDARLLLSLSLPQYIFTVTNGSCAQCMHNFESTTVTAMLLGLVPNTTVGLHCECRVAGADKPLAGSATRRRHQAGWCTSLSPGCKG